MLEREFDLFQELYRKKFEYFYPSKNGTGFDETNLSVNFATAYEQLHSADGEICFAWYELQFGKKNNLHLDVCIINISRKEIILVESKRLKSIDGQAAAVRKDIDRINAFDVSEELAPRINDISDYAVYGLILADIWTENAAKTAVFQSLLDGTYQQEILSGMQNVQFYVRDFSALNSGVSKWMKTWTKADQVQTTNKDSYKIAGFSWCVHGK